jgi:hypothetical protein
LKIREQTKQAKRKESRVQKGVQTQAGVGAKKEPTKTRRKIKELGL